jgi:N-acetylmuramoyl-L-alanine amidase
MKPRLHEHQKKQFYNWSKALKLFIAVAAITSFGFMLHNEPRKIKIVLDAAHGGNDHGAKHEQFSEKDVTAQIIGKIQAANNNENIEIQFTRVDDNSTTLQQRTDLINRVKPDLVLSLHVNYNKDSDTSGFEIYTSKADNANNAKSAVFANKLADKLSKKLATKNRGVKEAPLFILNKSEAPAIVIELGFLSNANDRALLTNGSSQDNIALTLLEFISEME